MSLPARALGAAGASLGAALSLGWRVAGAASAAARVPGRLLTRLDRALSDLGDIAGGVDAMHGEFVGMRADIVTLDDHVAGLSEGIDAVRAELSALRGEIVDPISDVPPMRHGVARLETQLETLSGRLEAVEALAVRFGRLGKIRGRGRPSASTVVVSEEELARTVVNGDMDGDRPAVEGVPAD